MSSGIVLKTLFLLHGIVFSLCSVANLLRVVACALPVGRASTATLPARRESSDRTARRIASARTGPPATRSTVKIKHRSSSCSVPLYLGPSFLLLGECKCPAGFKGRTCEIPCERGRYGIGCAYRSGVKKDSTAPNID